MSWDWKKIIKTINEASTGAYIGLKINEWMDMNEDAAFNDIEEFIGNSSTAVIDATDSILLDRINITFDFEQRKRVMKYYAYFKLGEFYKFGKWRGFPQ